MPPSKEENVTRGALSLRVEQKLRNQLISVPISSSTNVYLGCCSVPIDKFFVDIYWIPNALATRTKEEVYNWIQEPRK